MIAGKVEVPRVKMLKDDADKTLGRCPPCGGFPLARSASPPDLEKPLESEGYLSVKVLLSQIS